MHKHYVLILFIFIFTGCATMGTKYAEGYDDKDVPSSKEISQTFYLIGDAGLSPMGGMNPALKIFKEKLEKADKNSMAIFLGDNIYPAGLPDKKDSTVAYIVAKNHLDAQLRTLEKFQGKTLFIPGNHDWYTEGLIGLKREEKYVEKWMDDKGAYRPDNGCPLEEIEIGDDVIVVAIDTEWYLTNWDRHPGINDECEIKSRAKFLEELEGIIKNNRDKTTILAMHHPMFSYGPHGGQTTLHQQFYPSHGKGPLPILGSFINVLRKTTGASIADMQNKRYMELKKRIVTLAQYSEKVIFASGHEHTLQYIVEGNTPQIVSGSGAKEGATRLLNGSIFSTGKMGYAILEVYTDGSSRIRYYGVDDIGQEEFLFTTQVLSADRKLMVKQYSDTFPKEVKASVYTEEEIDKSGVFKTIWGDRYRKYYGTKITAPTVVLDTLFGGLTPVRKGGGHQSKSLRLADKNGKEYVMRALRKSAELYLQSMAFKDQYIVGEFEDTYTEGLLQDFYTGAHPYAPFTIGILSDAVGVLHTNPVLYYVPKQKALADFNEGFGDELYMIEEHVGDGHGDLKSFGYADKVESTDDLFEKLRRDEEYMLDEASYLRARLFDMVIGDWDRHSDQWRWAEIEDKATGKTIFKAIPRDRDQVFSIMGDGALMGLATRVFPPLKLMEGFHENVRNVRGFNTNPYPLDMALLTETTKSQWEKEVAYIQEHLTPEVIDAAFELFPKEVRDNTVLELKRILLSRLQNLPKIANNYYNELNAFAVVTGTDKDDWFEINALENGDAEVKAYRIIDGKKEKQFFHKIFDPAITKELWVYGLDDEDHFEIKGDNPIGIKVRLIGGRDNDIYDFQENGKVFIYDYKARENTIKNKGNAKIRLTNDYEINTYQPLHLKKSTNQIVPTIGYNPDDGAKIGLSDTYTYNGFLQNPFTSQHTVNASFYFATSGFELGYMGEFAHIFENWNLGLNARFTSPNFSINFFGYGNDTENLEDELELDYNRVRLKNLSFAPSLIWRGSLGAKIETMVGFEQITVEETADRFINTFYQASGEENTRNFLEVQAGYSYSNTDNNAFPTLGMATSFEVGYKTSVDGQDLGYGYVVPSLSFNYKLIPDGRLVLATKWKAHFNIGNDYEFYQAASIGASDGPRGFRNQRFTGKTSYYQNTDLRYSLRKIKTGLLPLAMGIYGGFDYGRIWLPGEDSNTWHTSYGGGFFFNGADLMSVKLALFQGEEGPRFSFGLGFGF
ncbi:metallophosphoesterase [Flavobacteriaceae bacterium KMM 6897]|nr:metallophosphoesterase [Flavobacteriaceae bacterium KMM 6897]